VIDRPTIRPMRPEDWRAVRAIYEQGIADGDSTFETEAPSWEAWDAAHLAVCRLVACEDAEVVGWAALVPVSRRPVYRGVVEVSEYVARQARGRGVGGALLDRLIADTEAEGIWTLRAGIFPENEASLALHRSRGFRDVGRHERIGQHGDRWRDVLLLERRSPTVGA
jgi:L-amino acid N-acyltransferase YncA